MYSFTQTNGFEVSVPYYLMIDRNRDLTITPHVYSKVLPAAEIEYRALTGNGAYKVERNAPLMVRASRRLRQVRPGTGYSWLFWGSGRFQLDPRWSVTGAGRT